MCGIAGMISGEPRRIEPRLVQDMINAIRYRGPDDSGVYADEHAGLGHARLSIIDIDGGAQPMSNADGSLWITFNGEIFNYLELREELIRKGHRFRTRSDTEVILHLYREEGERCVERFNGQWAFAIWDRQLKKLFLSRDRMGIRPLFYTEVDGRFLFASEIKALAVCPDVNPELDLEALIQTFTFWASLPGRTAFRGIRELLPGYSLTLEDGQIRLREYWRLEPMADPALSRRHPDDLAEELRALLLDATRLRLRADVPVGTYLSGGLDSTLVTALAGQASGRGSNTFSVAFRESEFDETPWQQVASDYLGTSHSAIECCDADIREVFTKVVWHAEAPILRTAPAPLYRLAKLVRESGFKVVLSGEGADEIFGGYDIFMEAKIRSFCATQPESLWRPLLLKRLYPYMEGIRQQPLSYLKAFFQVTPSNVEGPFFSHLPRWSLGSRIRMFLSDAAREATKTYDPLADLESWLPAEYAGYGPFARAEYLETRMLLPGYILSSQGDRVSMAYGVEARYPFLDHRVVEFATRLSVQLKMKVLDQKHLLKRAAAGLIPEPIRRRSKQPYRAPDGVSFMGPTPDVLESLLSSEALRRTGLFDSDSVTRLVAKFQSGRPTGVGENMALVGILSTQALAGSFVDNSPNNVLL